MISRSATSCSRRPAARGVTVHVAALDMTDRQSIDDTVETILAEASGLYGLVNNAGIGLRGCVEDLEDDEVRTRVRDERLRHVRGDAPGLPHLRERPARGRIITISSVGGRISTFGLSAYCATKFAQEGFAEALALEVAPFGLHSVLIEPASSRRPAGARIEATHDRA